ncbi:MAG: DNRLRE domain-containing protein [Ferruginibacter sp.]
MRALIRTGLMAFFSAMIFSSCQNEAAQLINQINHPAPVVDAGPARIVYLPVATTTMNGSATSVNGTISGYLWSMVSGPNVPLIMTPGSSTTVISNLVQGTYLFQLMAVDSAGYTGVDTATVKVFGTIVPPPPPPPVPVTLTLQPATNVNEFLFAGGTGFNSSGHSPDLPVGTWTTGGNSFYHRSALRFDISSIPAAATIVSAKLTLYSSPAPQAGNQVNPNSGTDNSFFIRRISSQWSTSNASWSVQPATTPVNQVSIPHTNLSVLDLIDIDVKNLVIDMRSSGDYGMMMLLQNEVFYNIRQFASSYNSNASKHPKLVVVYQ